MRYFLPLALCVAVGVTAGPPAGYEIRPMTWKGAIEKSGPEMSFDGTIQDVTAQIRSIKPGFSWANLTNEEGGEPVSKRGYKGQRIRNVGGRANTCPIQSGADNLRDMKGNCQVDAGPSVCSRLSCVQHAAVWLCNDDSKPIAPACAGLADYVEDIKNNYRQTYGSQNTAQGQERNTDKWNVVVGMDLTC
ncbi:hypothetical protein F4819DRAFT_502199 [Hypoxylon fuscum]|nr:hypothetical protein F4819DRAFT_502199 [Hypoxylon fuscum]